MSEFERIAEKNARAGARGVYIRWLAERFGTLDLMLTQRGEDRVSLRRIYVPVRVDTEDRADESLGGPEKALEEQLPGQDALELIADSRFVAISGRPGSGKTTLVQALIGELTREGPSPVRDKLAGERGILPVPLILRDYQDGLDGVRGLDDLLELWWSHAADEAGATGFALDVPRLKASYADADDGDAMPLLVLFDGLDEVGGRRPRQRVLKIAARRNKRVRCALVTGRPGGFTDLSLDGVQLIGRRQLSLFPEDNLKRVHHLQPFAFPQIRDFITRFLRLRQEWQVEARRLLTEFESALQDPRRPHLLNLARRPIFLTLMALVHVNERRMPHGRADLYERIVDLYLNRQMQAKRLQHMLDDQPMPHWDQREVRRALGFLAWRSQHREPEGSDRNRGGRPPPTAGVGWVERSETHTDPLGPLQQAGRTVVPMPPEPENAKTEQGERRQVIWTRAELEGQLRALLAGETDDRRPFSDLTPGDAPQLLDYYLHPAGLLVDPAEGRYQFAHLSFQEFLCAEYIHGRAKARGSRRFLEELENLLYPHLARPGWDEVGLLLLCIHSAEGAQTDPDAHLEILAELDLAEEPQARLLVEALTGRELDYAEDELVRWLPLAVAAALVQPDAGLAERFGRVPAWAGPGLDLLRQLFEDDRPLALLAERLRQAPPGERLGLAGEDAGGLLRSAEGRWLDLGKALSLAPPFDSDSARDYALLRLANESGWVPKDPERPDWLPIADPGLERSLADWLVRVPTDGERGRLYRRWPDPDGSPRLPVISAAASELDALAMPRGPLWESLAPRIPLDLWLLQGESLDDFYGKLWFQPVVLFSLYPEPLARILPALLVIAVTLYQSMRLADSLSGGQQLGKNVLLRARSQTHSRAWSLSWSPMRRLTSSLRWTRPPPTPSRSLPRTILVSLKRARSLALSQLRLKLRSPLRSRLWVASRSPLLPQSLARSLQPATTSALTRTEKRIEGSRKEDKRRAETALETAKYRWAALDWFAEQSEDPDLMRRRGLRPGEPLPRQFALFEPDGRLRDTLPRSGLLQLRDWLANDDAILAWTFPAGLSAADEAHLRSELHTLHHYERPDGGHGQPWSPLAAIEAALSDWPEDEPTRDVSLAAAERDLLAVLDELFPERPDPGPG